MPAGFESTLVPQRLIIRVGFKDGGPYGGLYLFGIPGGCYAYDNGGGGPRRRAR